MKTKSTSHFISKRFRNTAAALLCVLSLSGCASVATDTAGHTVPQISFAHLQPLVLQVADIRADIAPASDAEGSFVVPPDQAFRSYFAQRFRAGGNTGMLRASIEQAKVVRSYQTAEKSALDFLGVGGRDVYELSLEVRLEHLDSAGNLIYGTSVSGKRILKLSEHASVAEREQEQVKMLEALFRDLDPHITTVVMHGMRLAPVY